MNEFKIGDKVKIINSDFSNYKVGDIGVVIEDPDGVTIGEVCVLAELYGYNQCFEAYQLELVNE